VPAGAARLDIPVGQHAGATISFDCPRCGFAQSQEISERATMLLMRTGIGVAVGLPEKDPGGLRSDRSR